MCYGMSYQKGLLDESVNFKLLSLYYADTVPTYE
jgi:hypothetical protein